jgi:hypothetical protein
MENQEINESMASNEVTNEANANVLRSTSKFMIALSALLLLIGLKSLSLSIYSLISNKLSIFVILFCLKGIALFVILSFLTYHLFTKSVFLKKYLKSKDSQLLNGIYFIQQRIFYLATIAVVVLYIDFILAVIMQKFK